MNIIGIIDPKYDNRPYIPAKIESQYLEKPVEIFFLIDTGAFKTQISSYDAYRNNLYSNTNLIQDPITYSGIGGGSINAYILPKCKLKFESTNKFLVFNIGGISILYPKNQQGIPSTIKSMIGMDILKSFDILFEQYQVILRRK